jgi:hypothetical protein
MIGLKFYGWNKEGLRVCENHWWHSTFWHTCISGPIHPTYNPSFSAYFFSWNSVFLSQQISQQCFSAGLSEQPNGASIFSAATVPVSVQVNLAFVSMTGDCTLHSVELVRLNHSLHELTLAWSHSTLESRLADWSLRNCRARHIDVRYRPDR